MSNTEYIEYFKALVRVVETYGGAYGQEPGQIRAQLLAQMVAEANLTNHDTQQLKKAEEICQEEYLLCMLLCRADSLRYQQLKNNLANDMTKGTDNLS
jgi:hypothetical protein